MTPNLDTLGHHWVVALAGYNMKLEYLKGSNNKVADALSQVSTQKLDEETVTELLNYARNGSASRAETANIHVIEEGEHMDQEVIVRYTQIVKQHKNFRNLANQDWVIPRARTPSFPMLSNGFNGRGKITGSLKNTWPEWPPTTRGTSTLPGKRNLPCRIICYTFRSPPPIARTRCRYLSFRLWIGKPL